MMRIFAGRRRRRNAALREPAGLRRPPLSLLRASPPAEFQTDQTAPGARGKRPGPQKEREGRKGRGAPQSPDTQRIHNRVLSQVRRPSRAGGGKEEERRAGKETGRKGGGSRKQLAHHSFTLLDDNTANQLWHTDVF